MSSKRLINIYYDVVNNIHYDSDGISLRKALLPYIIYKEKPLVNLYLVIDSSLTPFTQFDGTETFSVSIDNDFASATDPICKTANSGINVNGDFLGNSSTNADPANGEISVRLDALTTEYRSRVGTDQKLNNTYMELQAFSGSDLVFACQMPLWHSIF